LVFPYLSLSVVSVIAKPVKIVKSHVILVGLIKLLLYVFLLSGLMMVTPSAV